MVAQGNETRNICRKKKAKREEFSGMIDGLLPLDEWVDVALLSSKGNGENTADTSVRKRLICEREQKKIIYSEVPWILQSRAIRYRTGAGKMRKGMLLK